LKSWISGFLHSSAVCQLGESLFSPGKFLQTEYS
jgi:hypothetical protein